MNKLTVINSPPKVCAAITSHYYKDGGAISFLKQHH